MNLTKICSVFLEILLVSQNWTSKQEVGHCDLILLQIFFILIILKTKVPLMLHTKFQLNIPSHSREKVDLMVLAFSALVAILDS